MRIAAVVLASMALSASSSAGADPITKDFLAKVDLASPNYLAFWLIGTGNGYLWANAALEAKGRPPLFCQPGKLTLTPEQELQIFKDYVGRHPAYADAPGGLVLLNALEETFPCPAK